MTVGLKRETLLKNDLREKLGNNTMDMHVRVEVEVKTELKIRKF